MPTKEEQKKFAYEIDCIVANTDYNYIEAIVEYCEKTGLEIEVAAKLINSCLKKKLERDAVEHNMIKLKYNKLPI